MVFDDVTCSRKVNVFPAIKPGKKIRFWGYRSDGRVHRWEASQSATVLEGPPDKSPVGERCKKDEETNPIKEPKKPPVEP